VRSDVTVSEGGERDAAEVEPFDASPALGFLLDAEIRGQVRPIELRIPDDEQCDQRRDRQRQEQRADVVEQPVAAGRERLKATPRTNRQTTRVSVSVTGLERPREWRIVDKCPAPPARAARCPRQ
jgi:hypothetical protein